MRKSFTGYYRPTKEEFEELWDNGIVIPDTNVLLNLYRYSPNTSSELVSIFSKVINRLWLPHQVAMEFHFRRLDEIADQAEVYEKITNTLNRTESELGALLRRGHISIETEGLLKTIKEAFNQVKQSLDSQKETHPNLFIDDTILSRITELFGDNIGDMPSQKEIDEIIATGEVRFKNLTPPGYRDSTKKGEKQFEGVIFPEKYGDLIIWLQIIDKARQEKRPVLFITDDNKEDWWWTYRGRTIGPRPELVMELKREVGKLFYMYSPARFMEHARDRFNIRIAESSVNEARDVAAARDQELSLELRVSRGQLVRQRWDLVKQLYDFRCQVCGITMRRGPGYNIDITHIMPLSVGGPDSMENVLCLCPNHHQLFDNGAFAVNENYELIGADGSLKVHPEHEVGAEFLKFHREHIYREL